MRFERVHIAAMSHELPSEVVTTRALEESLAASVPGYPLPIGELERLTGIRERRWWPQGASLVPPAARAARKALLQAGLDARELDAVLYAGVCRERFEPATAYAVADALGLDGALICHDVGNACLGVLTAMLDLAARIELGHVRAGLVVSCESAREIVEETRARLMRAGGVTSSLAALATFTGGSGAAAVVLTDGRRGVAPGARLRGATQRTAPRHHALCTWGMQPTGHGTYEQVMATDSAAVLRHGVELGAATWRAFLDEMAWTPASVDRVVAHQVGRAHQSEMQRALDIDPAKDHSSYETLGNTGSAAVPITASLAAASGVIRPGDRVALLGIGSGLGCLMMGVES